MRYSLHRTQSKQAHPFEGTEDVEASRRTCLEHVGQHAAVKRPGEGVAHEVQPAQAAGEALRDLDDRVQVAWGHGGDGRVPGNFRLAVGFPSWPDMG